MDKKELNLNDEQYLEILLKIKEILKDNEFKVKREDCNITGMKSTETNCGCCCEDFVTKENSLFPEQFPERKTMKYRKSYHDCPFDMRETSDSIGCFYHCYIFHTSKYQESYIENIERMRQMVENKITKIQDYNKKKRGV